MPNPPRVFISYARSDGEPFATGLRARLEAEEPEITLWQDRARMEGGKDWWRQITDALDGVQFMVLVMTPAGVYGVAVTPDGRQAISASGDHTLKVWDLASGHCLATFQAGEMLTTCTVAPDGVTIVAGGASGRMHFLRLETV